MNTEKKTVLLGASDNPSRYSYIALHQLSSLGFPVVAIGRKETIVNDIHVYADPIPVEKVDTVTLYLSPPLQKPYYAYILSLNPRRVIFNPGTENDELRALLEKNNILALEACTLVMLQTGQY